MIFGIYEFSLFSDTKIAFIENAEKLFLDVPSEVQLNFYKNNIFDINCF